MFNCRYVIQSSIDRKRNSRNGYTKTYGEFGSNITPNRCLVDHASIPKERVNKANNASEESPSDVQEGSIVACTPMPWCGEQDEDDGDGGEDLEGSLFCRHRSEWMLKNRWRPAVRNQLGDGEAKPLLRGEDISTCRQ